MAIEVKNNQKSQEAVRYTGICPFQIVTINPTKDELIALGVNAQNDPVYIADKEGVNTLRLDIWLNNPAAEVLNGDKVEETAITTKFSIFLEDADVLNKNGDKNQFINNSGQSSWAKDINSVPDFLNKNGLRVAKKGEEQLIGFLFIWLGLQRAFQDKAGDDCILDTKWSDLVKGNVKELQGYVKIAQDAGNGIKVLLGAKEALDKNNKTVYYQDIYTKYIMRPGQRTYDKLTSSLNDEYGEFKASYKPDFKLRVFSSEESAISADTFTSPSVATATNNVPDNDLPF